MTTPPPKSPETETLDEIALRIAAGPYPSYSQLIKRRKLADEILSALRNRDERAVRIIDEHLAMDVCRDNCWTTIKKAIREGKSEKDKQNRSKRLAKIRQAVAHIENRLAVDPSGNNDVIRSLYYLARLAKKTK